MEERITISEASKLLEIEPHVLRYWEEELSMYIRRNEMGHRYYLKKDIAVLKRVKELKNQGIQLRAIKMLLHTEDKNNASNMVAEVKDNLVILKSAEEIKTVTSEDKMEQFQNVMNKAMAAALRENKEMLAEAIGRKSADEVSKTVIKELDYRLKEQQEMSEAHYRKIDEAIRSAQRGKEEAALTKKHSLFTKRHRSSRKSRKEMNKYAKSIKN